MTRARQTLRRGIPFSPNDLVAAMQLINDTIESISLRAQTSVPELKLMLDEIAGDVSSALHWLSNDLSAGECQLQDKSILSAIRDRQGLLNDISIEVALRA